MKKLIKTMIVEDERIILDDLLAIIDWKAEGFDIVATAPNEKSVYGNTNCISRN